MSTYEELVAQREELDRQIEEARHLEKAVAVEKIRALVKQFQLTVEDCGFKQQKNVTKPKQVVVAKFRGPNGETWSGRGRVPGWLTALESQGTLREKLSVEL